jgi:hypothetical protein
MGLGDSAQVSGATRELILLTELLNNGRGQPRMELDQATASNPRKQACPSTVLVAVNRSPCHLHMSCIAPAHTRVAVL